MSTYSRKEPMSKRLFNSRMQGGPHPRHLKYMASILCTKNGIAMPDLNWKDQNTIAYWLKTTFGEDEINSAHERAVEDYKRKGHSISTQIQDGSRDLDEALDQALEKATKLEKKLGDGKASDKIGSGNTDTEYVLRTDYDKDLSHTAKIFLDLEEKIKDVDNQSSTSRDILSKDIIKIKSDIEGLKGTQATQLEVKLPEIPLQDAGIVHKQFPLLVKAANARLPNNTRLNVWLYGPAGTGKTHAAEKLGTLFFGNEKFREMNSKSIAEFREQYKRDWSDYNYSPTLSTGFEVMGYNDAHGQYVPTPFYLTWKYGGVFLLDEIDGSMQDALLKLNGALSSTYASFPCGIVQRHPDAVILAGANTTGYGGDIEYLGTMKQNVAFLDRWTFLHWPHDNALEHSLVRNKNWLSRVKQVRERLQTKKVKGHVITMRASLQGEALLAAGIDWASVEEMVLRKGLPQGTWDLIK